MKATGIVRRIDDLGRVVVPKEIRRTLRIREGDPLEIFIDREGEVILKKYSPIHELGNFAQEYAEALFDSMHFPTLICDRDEVIAISGESKKDYLNKSIGKQLEQTMESRNTAIQTEKAAIEIVEGKEADVSGYTICPIIASGDPIGCVMMFAKDGNTIGETEKKVIETAAGFLAKQME